MPFDSPSPPDGQPPRSPRLGTNVKRGEGDRPLSPAFRARHAMSDATAPSRHPTRRDAARLAPRPMEAQLLSMSPRSHGSFRGGVIPGPPVPPLRTSLSTP